MKSNLKKILLTSTVFTCLNGSFNLIIARDIETTATPDYHSHHNEHFIDKIGNNPLMKEIQAQQQAHRDTLRTDVALMLGAIDETVVTANRESLKNIITAALTADADAINDVEDKHDAKTADDEDTAQTLREKATKYQTAKASTPILEDIQHYRLAYFLMIKLKPWIEKNYNKDRVEVETILKDQIPTHYPEWLVDDVAEKIEILKLNKGPVVNKDTVTVNFPIAIDADSLKDAKVYKLGDNQNPLSVKIQAATDRKSATITGLTQYGVYYVEVGGKQYCFTVENTAANEFIYDPNGIVKIDSQPNPALVKEAEKDPNFKPTLSFSGGNDVMVSLDGSNWQKLLAIDANAFIMAAKTVQFKGLGVGEYTFEVASPTPERFSTAKTSFKVLPQIIKPTATAASRDYVENDKKATILSFGPFDKVKVNHTDNNVDAVYGSFDNAAVEPNKLVTVRFGFKNTLEATKQNYLLIPTAYTTASINGVTTVAGGSSGSGGGGSNTPSTAPTLTGQGFTIGLNSGYNQHELRAIGSVTNIPAGTYNVSINAIANRTLVVENGDFYVSLFGLIFASGESVTVTITGGEYDGKTFSFNVPTFTPTFSPALNGRGTVSFAINSSVFNGKTPSNLLTGNYVTDYNNASAITSGSFTANYATETLGLITPAGRISLEGTNFTFTAAAVNSTFDSSNFTLTGYLRGDVLTILDFNQLIANGTAVTGIQVFDTDYVPMYIESTTATFDGHAFIITLSNGAELTGGETIKFTIGGTEYTVLVGILSGN